MTKKQRRTKREPIDFPPVYLSTAHPDYADVEGEFAITRMLRLALPKRPRGMGLPLMVEVVAALRDPERRDQKILYVAKNLGPDALHPRYEWPELATTRTLTKTSPTRAREVPNEIGLRDEIPRLAWKRIRECYRLAREGTLDEQAEAAAFLMAFGRALAGDRRGRRRRTVTQPFAVIDFYLRQLFRLHQARKLLPACRCGSPDETVRALAKVCGIDEAALRAYLLDAEGGFRRLEPPAGRASRQVLERLYRFLTVEEQVRVWTAAHFGVTPPTVSNLLANPWRYESRK